MSILTENVKGIKMLLKLVMGIFIGKERRRRRRRIRKRRRRRGRTKRGRKKMRNRSKNKVKKGSTLTKKQSSLTDFYFTISIIYHQKSIFIIL